MVDVRRVADNYNSRVELRRYSRHLESEELCTGHRGAYMSTRKYDSQQNVRHRGRKWHVYEIDEYINISTNQ